ncbi:hypothetical protein N0V83_003999 [Neocucurbitaria cava]|uniref:Dpy-30 domain-containing protein n=1 Tax=Neocucurbitaria cava TaxID=798079 RepID=A0A9W8YAR1_9PLEO|nr:hypothetical protein N0V83_003999 [Neocucurbitaria cava]
MAEPSPNPAAPQATEPTEPIQVNGVDTTQNADVIMADSSAPHQPTVSTQPPTPQAAAQTPSSTPSAPLAPLAPVAPPQPPAAVSTSSRTHSPHPQQQQQAAAPTQPIPHGSPTRVYLNQHVTPHLLEAMKHLATAEPDKPLKWLSEFLAVKSAEIEGP